MTRGCRSRHPLTARGTTLAAKLGRLPTVMTRARRLPAFWIRVSANSNSSLINLACEHRSSPNAVAVIPFGPRSRSFTPSPSSSRSIAFESAGCETSKRLAALFKLPCSTTVARYKSLRESIRSCIAVCPSSSPLETRWLGLRGLAARRGFKDLEPSTLILKPPQPEFDGLGHNLAAVRHAAVASDGLAG